MPDKQLHSQWTLNEIVNSLTSIVDSKKLSSTSKVILFKSILLPPNWKWRLSWIRETFDMTEHEWRKVSKELKEGGYLRYNHQSEGKGTIKREIVISPCFFHPVAYHQDDRQQIYPPNKDNTNTIRTGGNISVAYHQDDRQQDEKPSGSSDVQNVHDGASANNCTAINPANIPSDLQVFDQWVYWKAETKTGEEKPSKIPYMSLTQRAKPNDPKTWLSCKKIQDWQEKGFTGIGFVLADSDPFTMVDLDRCVNDGKMNDFAKRVVKYFDSYTEISPSGTGLRIVVRGKLPRAIKRVEIEAYSERRYMAMTGWVMNDAPIREAQKKLDKIHKKYNPPPPTKKHVPVKSNGKFDMPKETIAEGERNNRLAHWAGVLLTKELPENEYYHYLHQINHSCCEPKLPEFEVTSIGESIWRKR